MPVNRSAPALQSEFSCFRPEFLGARFAEVAVAGGYELGGGTGVDVLRDGNQRDRVRRAARKLGRAGDPLADTSKILGDGHWSFFLTTSISIHSSTRPDLRKRPAKNSLEMFWPN